MERCALPIVLLALVVAWLAAAPAAQASCAAPATRSRRRTARPARPAGTSRAPATRASRATRPTSASTRAARSQFKIDAAGALPIDIYRMGYYGGRAPARSRATSPHTAPVTTGLPEGQRHRMVDCSSWARVGELGRARRRGLRHLLRQADPLGRRLEPHRLRRARRRRQLGPALPDVGHDLAGLQRLRRQQPVRSGGPPDAGPRAPTRSPTTGPSPPAATPRRTGCSTPSTRWSACSRPTATT